jgi:isopenicillin-N N-acyltransferase like protein
VLLYAAAMSAPAETALASFTSDATDPRERGRTAGAALAARAALCLDAYLPLFEDGGHARDDVRRFGARVLERTERWHAPLAAELEAFALGAQLEPELVAALNGRTELLALAECTTVGRCESADGPWLAQNWDWYANAPERCLVWSAAVDGARFATMTEAGILAKVGV